MKKINRMEIINFQSHDYTDLYFDNGVNVIIGPSDSGKTAIIRAMKWVLFNEPSGSAFVKQGTEETKVLLYFSDGTIIERGRVKNKNYYILSYKDKVERFEGFGQNMPMDISEASGIRKTSLNGQNLLISIADQLESPFLIAESPSVKSTAIGALAGTDIIDIALSNLHKEVYENKNLLKSQENLLSRQKEELEQYNYLTEEKIALDIIRNQLEKIDYLENRLINLEKLDQKYRLIMDEINHQNEILEALSSLEYAEEILTALAPSITRHKVFKNMNNLYQRLNTEEAALQNIIQETKSIESLTEITNKLNQRNNNYKELIVLYENWKNVKKNLKIVSAFITNIPVEKLITIEEDLEGKLQRYRVLENFSNNYSILKKRIEMGNKYIGKYEGLAAIDESIDTIHLLYKKEKELNLLQEKWVECNLNRKQLLDIIESTNTAINNNLTQYEEVLKNISECPYCKSKIDAGHRKSIMKEMREDYGL